jgi:spore coat polysaccharide biosynthesis protein SpsF
VEKAIIIQARTGSRRFPNKILKKIDNRSVLQYLIDKLFKYFNKKEIIIATTKSKNDYLISNVSKFNKIKIFRGSTNNLLKRYLDCSKKYNVKNIIRITSDCPLVDPKSINKMYELFKKKKFDYLSNTCPPENSKYPDGSDIEIFNYKSLKKLSKLKQSREDKEHIYGFWKNENIFKIKTLNRKNDISKFKYSLDYKSDLFLIKKVVAQLKEKKYSETPENITRLIKKNKKLSQISYENRLKYLENKKFKKNVS